MIPIPILLHHYNVQTSSVYKYSFFLRTIRDWNSLDRLSRSKLIPQPPLTSPAANAMQPSGNGLSPLLGIYRSTEVETKTWPDLNAIVVNYNRSDARNSRKLVQVSCACVRDINKIDACTYDTCSYLIPMTHAQEMIYVPGVWYCCRRTSTGSTGCDADTPLPEDKAIFAGSMAGACFHGDLRFLHTTADLYYFIDYVVFSSYHQLDVSYQQTSGRRVTA